MSRLSTVVRHPLVRAGLGPLRTLYYRRTFYPPPKVLANSMPKAGTNLLSMLLRLMPKMAFAGIHDALDAFHVDDRAELDWTKVADRLARVRNGQFATGHFPALPEFTDLTRRLELRVLVMFRDPRDMAVSYVFHVLGRERHGLHRRFVEQFTSFDERLLAVISGFGADELGPGLPSMAERLDAYLPWVTTEGAHTTRFEDLVGPRGGGDPAAQRKEIVAVGQFLDRPLEDRRVDKICERVWNPEAATFRKGVVGDWRNHFTDSHVTAFKRVAGRHLVELGYEEGPDW